MSYTEYADWGELHVQLQPLTRKLYEAMSRQEWDDAEKLACELSNVAFEIQRLCIKHNVRSGLGFHDKPSYLYEGA